MMKKFLLAFVCIAAVAGGLFLALHSHQSETDREQEAQTLRSRKIADRKAAQRAARENSRRRIRAERAQEQALAPKREKPVIVVTEEDEETLDELQKEVLKELGLAIGNNDIAAAQQLVARIREMGLLKARQAKSTDWMKFVPAKMRSSAVSALGWFGGDAIPELVEFIADPEPEIAMSAEEQFELCMQDPTLGDRARAEIIKQVGTILTDEGTVDWMMMSAIDARNSVAIGTLQDLAQSGTEQVKARIPNSMLFLTGEDIPIEQSEAWLEQNPDQPDDDLFYGSLMVSEGADGDLR